MRLIPDLWISIVAHLKQLNDPLFLGWRAGDSAHRISCGRVRCSKQSRVFWQVLDSHIATEYVKGQHMKKYKNKVLQDVVADKQKWQKDVKGASFVNGPASGVCVRCVEYLRVGIMPTCASEYMWWMMQSVAAVENFLRR